jgi:predicted nucleotidyltransferase
MPESIRTSGVELHYDIDSGLDNFRSSMHDKQAPEDEMSKAEVLRILAEHRADLRERFGISSLALFGSVARSKATASSDVDLLVEFNHRVGLFHLAETQAYPEMILGISKVDLITKEGIRPSIKERILNEAIDA